uniref:Protein TRANSPARENT TESTA 12 n=1 Tax=Aegilops tauschii subsp. strangulata TaxID=200361 RepID=A0A453QUL1_AEGTS
MRGDGEAEEASAPLLVPAAKGTGQGRVAREWWEESKRLWRIVGPAIFQRVALYGINVVSQAFIGHIGDLELAAFSIASTVIGGFNFGFLGFELCSRWTVTLQRR